MLQFNIQYLIGLLSKYSVKQEDVIGVDITPSFIHVAQLNEEKSGWILEKIGRTVISENSDTADIVSNPDLYSEKLRNLIATSKIETCNAAVSIPITSAIIRTVTLPLMTDEEIKSAIEYDSLWNNIIQLDENLDEYSIFWQVIRRNTIENKMELLFVASKLSEINHYVDIVTKAGLNPIVVDIRCFAIRNVLKIQQSKADSTAALIEFGPNENYVLIVHDGAPFIYDLYVSEADRGLIKGGALSSDESAHRLHDRLSGQIRQAFRAFEAKFSTPIADTVLVVSPLQNIDKLLGQMQESLSEYRLELFDPARNLQIPLNLSQAMASETNPSIFSSVIGLATRKIDIFGYYKYVTGVNNVNLLPNRDAVKNVEKKKLLSQLLVQGTAILLALFVLGSILYWAVLSKNLAPEYEKALLIENEIQTKDALLAKMRAKKASYSGILKVSDEFKSNKESTVAMLEAVTKATPGGIWFTELNFDDPNALLIKGDAAADGAIVDFVDRLQHLPMISNATLQMMAANGQGNPRKGTGSKKFEIRCGVRLIEKPKTGVAPTSNKNESIRT